MKFPPETLMAYADGELDTETRRKIEFAMATDDEVAQQIARLKAQRLELQTAFAGMLDEPVPARLVEAAQSGSAGAAAQANVTELATARAAKSSAAKRRWSWPEFTSMAATLLVGLVIGRNMLQPEQALVSKDGRLEAGGALASALSQQAGGGSGAVTIGLTFKSRSGEYCRTFMTDAAAVAGLACRDAGAWRVEALARTAPGAGGDYRMAGAELPPSIVRAVEDSMTGEAFDAREEAEAMRNGWR
jgi:hypothetical protein